MPFLCAPLRIPDGSCGLMDPNSSIAQLFRTNSVPSPMDTPRIHELLEERTAELAIFAEQIGHARAHVRDLETQRDQVQAVVQELQALLSPVRRVPMDVMARVFEHCTLDRPLPSANPRTAPMLLAQVCRSWRSLVFSLPSLWTTLQLDLPPASKDWEALVQAKSLGMHVWLSRSKSLPVSLFFNHAKGSVIPWAALVHLDKDILSLSCRLRELVLHFSPRSLGSLMTFTQSPLPSLEHLELQNTNSLPTSENPPPIVLHSAPKLKSLSVSWCSLDLRRFQIPWGQLQHLNLEYDASSFWNPVHSDYLQTLACCPNLTTLYLGIGAPINDIDPALITPVTLLHVTTFRSSIYVQTQYLAHFFDALHMPRLCHFDVKNVSLALGSFTGQTECLPFLARCADTLESACFNRVDIADPAVLSCLGQLHRLKSMSFLPGVLRLNHGLIAALAHDGEERICPALEVLQLRCSSAVPVDAIVHLVASRFESGCKLKRFSLQLASFDYGTEVRDDKINKAQAQLKKYVEDGLELSLTKASSSG